MSSSYPLYRYIFHGTRLNITAEEQPSFATIGLGNSAAWPPFNEGHILSKGTTTCIKVTLPSTKETVYFKRYNHTKKPWEFFLRRSKAANELINYQRLKILNIPTLDTIAFYEKRKFGSLKIACIVTKELSNTMQLDDFYVDVLLKMPTKQRLNVLNSLKQQLFDQLRTAHDNGFFHLDLKWRNILIQQNGDNYMPIWIDCPRGIQRRYLNYRLKVADLSGLARKALSFFTAAQLYRMLYQYLGPSATKKEARKLFLDISKHLSRRPPKILKR
ncbi:MAG: lipopolysaccharide kinase InaA family protein [Cycloclasticus sp.]